MSPLQHTRADRLNDQGVSLRYAGDTLGAGRAFLKALDAEPGHATAAANLSVLVASGLVSDPGARMATLDALWAYVRSDDTDPVRWTAFAEVLRTVRAETTEAAEHIMPVLLACLLNENVDHQRLTGLAFSVVRRHPQLSRLFHSTAQGAPAVDALLSRSDSWPALAHPALRLLLRRTVVPELSWELLFNRTRRTLALQLAGQCLAGPPDRVEEVAFALAHQCFTNGYVWGHDAQEVEAVEAVARTLGDRPLGEDSLDPMRVALLGAYVPLHSWDRADALLAWTEAHGRPSLVALTRRQVLEPLQEAEIGGLLPSLGAPESPISARVQEMYEEHPYPRWTRLPKPLTRPAATYLRRQFPWASVDVLQAEERPRILVAGCGTGRHLLHTATRFQGARVVGVDLSRASLAYAWRKALELGATDVSLLHGDILDLSQWPEPFHIIESSGVLHHMENPLAGWRVLTDLLAPGGFMKIGLYSERARRGVVAARDLIAQKGWTDSEDDIRQARTFLTQALGHGPGSPLSWTDFYSMHECRDLLFHVQEHRFTIPDIAAALDALGLEFVGWEGVSDGIADQVVRAHLSRTGEKGTALNGSPSLPAWHAYEEEHPDTFSGMYQFWVTKAG